ncbi:hypothetical protein GSY74_02035 [Sulfurovum sp. bin170]|uniref:hypothetical protein n=1 Tax=Sulfurovum sp. bin170 TaxID=2695268 RepID=UPI0013DFE8ED|nr:hypothetical protein [Sulfurovum sp. bin170]NEW60051.1 hypothetical protein [Sulfurovum sp. bin170]
MNTILTSFKFLVENNNNPLLIFNHKGKIEYFNHSAEFLAGIHLSHELFRLAVTYAPQSFGSRTVHLDLTYGMDSFYAITVLYESEEELCLYLYRKPRAYIPKNLSFDGYSSTDINLLLEANIELFKMRYNNKLTLFTDYSLPKFQMQQNSFSMLLRKLFEQYATAKKIDITLKINIGETIVIAEKKYPIIMLMVKSDSRERDSDEEIEKLTLQNHTTAYFQKESVILEIPCIVVQSTL